MKLAKLECEHFAGVPDGSYVFGPLQRSGDDVRFVAGARGAGKTRLLEAVVALKELVGAYRAPPPFASLLEPGARTGRIGGTFVLSDAERTAAELESNELTVGFGLGEARADSTEIARPVRDLFAGYSHEATRSKLEYFPASRNLPRYGEPTNELAEKLHRAGAHAAKYAGLAPHLVELSLADGARALRETATRGILMAGDAPDSLARYRTALAAVLPELRLRGAQLDDAGVPDLVFDRPGGGTVSVHHLSESQKQIFLLVATMLRLQLAHSIILLDAPELHLHAADQSRLLPALLPLGHDNQWIIASGSSEILKGARRDQMIVLGAGAESRR
jgi:hypothetical protein